MVFSVRNDLTSSLKIVQEMPHFSLHSMYVWLKWPASLFIGDVPLDSQKCTASNKAIVRRVNPNQMISSTELIAFKKSI